LRTPTKDPGFCNLAVESQEQETPVLEPTSIDLHVPAYQAGRMGLGYVGMVAWWHGGMVAWWHGGIYIYMVPSKLLIKHHQTSLKVLGVLDGCGSGLTLKFLQ